MAKRTPAMVLLLVTLVGTLHVKGEMKDTVYMNVDNILKVSVESTDVLIKSDREILNFPVLLEFGSDKFVLSYSRGRHTGKELSQASESIDGGKTWVDLPTSSPFFNYRYEGGTLGYLRDGAVLSIDAMPLEGMKGFIEAKKTEVHLNYHVERQVKNPIWGVRRFSKNGELLERWEMKVSNLPWEEASYENYGTILELQNGDLLAPFQCQVGPPTKSQSGGWVYSFCTFIARSTDGGKTFKHVWTIEPFIAGKKLGNEGLCEPDLAVLSNGDILCIMRSGFDSPMYQSRSKDGGRTWSQPVSTGWPGVKPKLRVLKNGVLACTTGVRPSWAPQVTYVLFSIDGTGEAWEPPFVVLAGPGCSYTWNMERDAKLYVLYSHSDFMKPMGTYGLPYQSIKWTALNVIKESRK